MSRPTYSEWRYRLGRYRLVCWARGHPQEFGYAAPNERGIAVVYRFGRGYGRPTNLVGTSCRCRRKRVELNDNAAA